MFYGLKTKFIATFFILFLTACGGGGGESENKNSGTITDSTAPIITLVGDNPITISQGSPLTDPGTTVTDNVDTGLTATITGTVDSLIVGDYILTYIVSDVAGNEAIPVTRTVTVADMTVPVITLIGDASMTFAQGSTFVDSGTTVTDNIDNGLTATATGIVDSLIVGDYILTYNVSDSAGNAASAVTRTVTVVDETAPEITLLGDNPMTVSHGSTYTEPSVTVTDNVDTGLIAIVSGTVDTAIVGDYILTYSVSDISGNVADILSRTVTVVDQTAPVITLIGDDTMILSFGDIFTELGAMVSDNVDTGLTATVTGNVNTTEAGDYLLTYEVSDSAGNAAVTITRTVIVSAAVFKLSAGFYDTCAYTGDDEKLRCFGYNNGAHGNGHTDTIGDSFGEASIRDEVCKGSAEQVLSFSISDDDPLLCEVNFTSKKIEWFEQGNDVALGSISRCHYSTNSYLIKAQQEASQACDNGAYAVYWGQDYNDDNNLSINEMGEYLIPAMLPDSELLDFDVAEPFGCGIFADKTTRCWGRNNKGQLGKGSPGDVLTADELGNALVPVNFGDGLYATEIHLNDSSIACALLNDGSIKCWGSNTSYAIGVAVDTFIGLTAESMGNNLLPIDMGTNPDTLEPYKATTMALNIFNGCAVLENGGVKCWGLNSEGNLGLGESNRYVRQVIGDDIGEMGDNLGFVLLGDFNAVSVSVGSFFNCALSDDNRMKCWGANAYGQLGLNDTENRGSGHEDSFVKDMYISNDEIYNIIALNSANDGPTLCPSAPANEGIQIAVGIDDGSPSGISDNGILEQDEINSTELLCDTDDVTGFAEADISYEESHLIIISYGLYGSDYAEMGNALPAVDLGVNETVLKVDNNYYNTCVLFDSGKVKCWGAQQTVGADSAFNIGDAPERSVALADYIDFGTTDKVVDITLGGYQSCVIFETGGIKCWGYSDYGETGQPRFYGDYLGDGLPEPEMGDNLPYVDFR